jgi:hypothetical protein
MRRLRWCFTASSRRTDRIGKRRFSVVFGIRFGNVSLLATPAAFPFSSAPMADAAIHASRSSSLRSVSLYFSRLWL